MIFCQCKKTKISRFTSYKVVEPTYRNNSGCCELYKAEKIFIYWCEKWKDVTVVKNEMQGTRKLINPKVSQQSIMPCTDL